jgi:hypothetical protein
MLQTAAAAHQTRQHGGPARVQHSTTQHEQLSRDGTEMEKAVRVDPVDALTRRWQPCSVTDTDSMWDCS